jgi:hypothetical protein
LSEDVKNRLEESYDDKLSNLHESISNLIFLDKNTKTVNEIAKNTKNGVSLFN